jgi:ABC-type dipeptide/oligopeptide/nickel transport system permease component
VAVRHALRNAFIPILTVIGLQFGTLLGGAVLTETVFSWPGIGQLLEQSINNRDFPLVQGIVLVFAAMFILLNIVTDLLYSVVDPRVRLYR